MAPIFGSNTAYLRQKSSVLLCPTQNDCPRDGILWPVDKHRIGLLLPKVTANSMTSSGTGSILGRPAMAILAVKVRPPSTLNRAISRAVSLLWIQPTV